MAGDVYYKRNLPHWHPAGAPLFITWRLHGSLPRSLLIRLDQSKNLSPGKRFACADSELDRATAGPLWLKEPRIAENIVASLQRGQGDLRVFHLHAYVVMANHVHVLLTPQAPVPRITRGIKRHTADFANTFLGRQSERFWAEESFDRWCRTPAEFERIRTYIEHNPVKAKLVERAADWPWSSARP